MKFCITLLILSIIAPSKAGFFGPDNFDECLLDKMEDQDKSMKRIAIKVCRKKFPEIKPVIFELTADQLAQLNGNAGINFDSTKEPVPNKRVKGARFKTFEEEFGFSPASFALDFSDKDFSGTIVNNNPDVYIESMVVRIIVKRNSEAISNILYICELKENIKPHSKGFFGSMINKKYGDVSYHWSIFSAKGYVIL